MTSISPPVYWRQTQNWKKLLGKTGTVVLATTNFVLIEIEGKKYELMTTPDCQAKIKDKAVCVFRRLSSPSPSGLIEYGIKAHILKEDKKKV
jgi:hypothetical protein